MARPGPGNGCRPTMPSGSPSSRPMARTSSLNRLRSGSTSSNCRSSGSPPPFWWAFVVWGPVAPRQPAHVVVALDVRGPGAATRLDDVGVEGALHEEAHRLALRGRLRHHRVSGPLEGADELPADDLALLLGVAHAVERGEEPLALVHDDE